MRKTDEWDSGTQIDVERLGECTAYRRIVHGEYYQWKIKYYCEEVIGDYCYDNIKAFDNALAALKKRFNNIFSND
jgi:hypothetical protein